ncbi:MAG: hypothetical protein EON95_01075 [Caulobacteraceae bacterium]|nr:MAG: hypothetical protein EON95_01075 [Caulobacteraceae bacterium]
MLLPIVAAFEWLAVIVNGPMDTDRLLTQALGYCRQAGDGEATALVKARALRNGWQEVWEDTSGLDTFEVVEREIEWRRFDRGRLRSIHVTFYDNPDQDGWRGVCGVEVDGFPKDFYSHFRVARAFTRGLRPLVGPDGRDRKQIEAMDLGDRVKWFGDRQWRLDFGRFGDEKDPSTGLTYFVAGEKATAPK